MVNKITSPIAKINLDTTRKEIIRELTYGEISLSSRGKNYHRDWIVEFLHWLKTTRKRRFVFLCFIIMFLVYFIVIPSALILNKASHTPDWPWNYFGKWAGIAPLE